MSAVSLTNSVIKTGQICKNGNFYIRQQWSLWKRYSAIFEGFNEKKRLS